MTIKNLDTFKKNLNKKMTVNARKNAKIAITRGANLVENEAKESIMRGGSGKTYEKYNPRRTHTASKSGQPPATDTGFLVSQITMNVKSNADGSIVGQIISAAPYSKPLEFGTVNMDARPFMQPALQKNKRKIKALFKKGILK